MPKHHTILCRGDEIRARLDEISAELMSALPELRDHGELTLAVILDGAVNASADLKHALLALCPSLTINEQALRISRTQDTTLVEPRLLPSEITPSLIEDKYVIIIDDLVDQGATLHLANEVITGFRPKELLSVVIIHKRNDNETLFKPDYSCVKLDYDCARSDSRWLFGYGMDLRGQFRDLDYVAECPAGHNNQEDN